MLISQIFSRGESDAPLVILVHGRSGNVQVMQAFKSCIPETATIVSVQAPIPDPEGGFRWWDFKAKLEFSEDSHSNASFAAKLFEEWLTHFIESEGLKPSKLFAVGFSQGAALLSYVIQIRPGLFCGVALLAGFVVRSSNLLQQAQGATTKSSVLVAHGSKDETVPYTVASDGVEFLRKLGYTVSFICDPVGHKIGLEGMKALKGWLKELVLGKLSSAN